jgi:hypothetical protein
LTAIINDYINHWKIPLISGIFCCSN